jgi:hypothetical protein
MSSKLSGDTLREGIIGEFSFTRLPLVDRPHEAVLLLVFGNSSPDSLL